jgi:hypothetical protein
MKRRVKRLILLALRLEQELKLPKFRQKRAEKLIKEINQVMIELSIRMVNGRKHG